MLHPNATPLFFATVLAACSSASSAVDTSDAGPGPDTRAAITCADVASQEATAGFAFEPGSWGNIPAALQHVPPGGTFCGLQSPGSLQAAVVLTGYSGQALADFYAPFLSTLGCTEKAGTGTAGVAGTYAIHCEGGSSGMLASQPLQQVATVFFAP